MKILVTFILTVFSLFPGAQEPWTLQRCIDHAFQHSLNIRQANLNVKLGEVNKTNAFGNMLPNLNASASHGYNWGQTIDPFTNSFATERIRSNSFGASTSMNLFSGLRIQNTRKQSAIDLLASKSDLERVKNDIALNVSAAFLTVLLNKEFLEIAERNLETTTRQVSRVNILVNAGQLAQGNLSEVQAQLATDEASLVSARNNYDLAELSLMQLIQLTPQEMQTFVIAEPEADTENIQLPGNPETAIQSALANFPQVKSAETRLKSAEVGESIAKGGIYPNLGVSFSYGTGYSGASQVPIGDPILGEPYPIGYVDGTLQPVYTIPFTYDYQNKPFSEQLEDNLNQSLFFSLQIPIFNGFNTRSDIRRAQISRENAEISLEQTKLQLTQEIQRAYADARAALSNYNAGLAAVEASERAFGYAESRYEQGVINNVEYADARTRLDNALTNLARNKYEYIFRAKILEFYQGRAITLR